MEKPVKKLLAAVLISATIMPSVALADWNGHHHGWGGPRQVYRGGGGGDMAGALIGGLLIGGMLGAMANQPTYAQPQPYYDPYYQPVCNRYFAGRDYYGRPVFQTVCQ